MQPSSCALPVGRGELHLCLEEIQKRFYGAYAEQSRMQSLTLWGSRDLPCEAGESCQGAVVDMTKCAVYMSMMMLPALRGSDGSHMFVVKCH